MLLCLIYVLHLTRACRTHQHNYETSGLVVRPSRLQDLARDAAEKASIYEELQALDVPALRARLNITDGGDALRPAPMHRIPLGCGHFPPVPLPFAFGAHPAAQAALVPSSSISSNHIPLASVPKGKTEARSGAERAAKHRAQEKRAFEQMDPAEMKLQLAARRAFLSATRAKQRQREIAEHKEA